VLIVPTLCPQRYRLSGPTSEAALNSEITLRPMLLPADGRELSNLYHASSDTGQIQIGPRYHVCPYLAFAVVQPSSIIGKGDNTSPPRIVVEATPC
jgi:hypothetical protein